MDADQTTEYAILLPGVEAHWEQSTPEQQQAAYARHGEFARLLAERGHQVTGGAQLANSREARTLRVAGDGSQSITEGPYAESAEQLTGFYLVRSADLDDLVEVCRVLGAAEGAIEIRPCVEVGGQ